MPVGVVGKFLKSQQEGNRCWCMGTGCCHIRTWVYIIGIIELLALAATLVTFFVLYELSADSFINRTSKPIQAIGLVKNGDVENRAGAGGADGNFTLQNGVSNRHHSIDSSESSEEKGKMRKGGKSSDSKESSMESEDDDSDEDDENKREMVYLRAKHRYYVRSLVASAAAFVLHIFVVAIMFNGLSKGRPGLLLPHLGVQVLSIIALGVVIILYSIWCSSKDRVQQHVELWYTLHRLVSCWLIIGCCSAALLWQLVSFWRVLLCYTYMRNLNQQHQHSKREEKFWTTYNGKLEDLGKQNQSKWTTVSGTPTVGNKV